MQSLDLVAQFASLRVVCRSGCRLTGGCERGLRLGVRCFFLRQRACRLFAPFCFGGSEARVLAVFPALCRLCDFGSDFAAPAFAGLRQPLFGALFVFRQPVLRLRLPLAAQLFELCRCLSRNFGLGIGYAFVQFGFESLSCSSEIGLRRAQRSFCLGEFRPQFLEFGLVVSG